MVDPSFFEIEIWHVAAAAAACFVLLASWRSVIDTLCLRPLPSLTQISAALSFHVLVRDSRAEIASALALPDRTAVPSTSGYFFFEKFKSLPSLPGRPISD